METGQRISEHKINIDELSSRYLSIQVGLNGFSFCTLDKSDSKIINDYQVYFEKKQTPTELLSKLAKRMEEALPRDIHYNSVKVIHDNELQVVIPNALFDENCLADYLKFNGRILETDYLSYDPIDSIESKVVYVPYVNVNNYLYDLIGSFEFVHLSSVLIESVIHRSKNDPEKKMFVHIGKSSFEIIVVQRAELIFYNSFKYESPEDFIYYLLFTFEQLQLNPESLQLILMGAIREEDELFKVAYKYVRNVELESNTQYQAESGQDKDLSAYYGLLHSF